MLKRPITYTDFDDNQVVEEHYFNLNSAELMELEGSIEGGLAAFAEQMEKTGDIPRLMREIKRIVLASYGQKSEDGRRFLKSEEISNEFAQTLAFDALFNEFTTSESAMEDFFFAIMPKELVAKVAAQRNAPKVQDKPTSPPPVPRTRRTNG